MILTLAKLGVEVQAAWAAEEKSQTSLAAVCYSLRKLAAADEVNVVSRPAFYSYARETLARLDNDALPSGWHAALAPERQVAALAAVGADKIAEMGAGAGASVGAQDGGTDAPLDQKLRDNVLRFIRHVYTAGAVADTRAAAGIALGTRTHMPRSGSRRGARGADAGAGGAAVETDEDDTSSSVSSSTEESQTETTTKEPTDEPRRRSPREGIGRGGAQAGGGALRSRPRAAVDVGLQAAAAAVAVVHVPRRIRARPARPSSRRVQSGGRRTAPMHRRRRADRLLNPSTSRTRTLSPPLRLPGSRPTLQ
jgi:hypothetical protein